MASSPGSLLNFAGVRLTFLICVVVAVGSWFATTQADLLAGDRKRPQNVDKTDSTQTTSLPLQQPASATSSKIAELPSIPTEVPRAAARIEGKPTPERLCFFEDAIRSEVDCRFAGFKWLGRVFRFKTQPDPISR